MGYSAEHYQTYDASFPQDLYESQRYVWQAAQWLSRKGYNVTVRPIRLRPTVAEMGAYADLGDLEIHQRIEVKHRRALSFTSREDYPYSTVMVDVCHTWDNAWPKPYAYLIFNREATVLAIVKGDTFPQWIRVEKMDSAKSRMRKLYECPLELVNFVRVRNDA